MGADKKDSLVLEIHLKLYSWLCKIRGKLSLLHTIIDTCYTPYKKDDKRLVDGYVILTTVLAMLSWLFWPIIPWVVLKLLIVGLGIYRIFEILLVQSGALFLPHIIFHYSARQIFC